MRYLSVCSGIEAASVAWHPLGWTPAAFSEIEAFPRAVLKHHYPDVPLHGDFTTIEADQYGPIDLLVGGTPCQSFSVAGLRKGLADDRGNLALEFLRLAHRTRARWVVWENVPGVLSSWTGAEPPSDLEAGREWEATETSDFGCFLDGLRELGYGFAYRVLDAQYIRVDDYPRAVPQRRNRVFVVGHLGDWRRAAAVLFERQSLSGNPPPRREAGQRASPTLEGRAGRSGETNFATSGGLIPEVATVLETTCNDYSRADGFNMIPFTPSSHGNYREGLGTLRANGGDVGNGSEVLVAHSLRADGFDASEDGTGRGTPLTIAFSGQMSTPQTDFDMASTLGAKNPMAVAHTLREHTRNNSNPTTEAAMHVLSGMAVRRLTPRECERLQGFPDDYTLVSYRGRPAADGPRYKALGNSMAVNCMRWIGRRIQQVEAILPMESMGGA